MAIIVADTKRSIGNEMSGATDAGGALARVEPLLTPEKLRSRFLFGIPMYAFLPNPVTRKREEYTADMQKDAIERAANSIELNGGFDIQPQQHTKRLPFDRAEYACLGYFSLPHRPVTEVLSLAIKPAGDNGIYYPDHPNVPGQVESPEAIGYGAVGMNAIYRISPSWIDPANLQRGQVNIIPLLPASVGGFVPIPSPGQGGAAFLTIMGSLGWVPALWEIEYITGFREGRIPLMVNELIGLVAAINILSEIGATNRVGNFSVGLDGAQQTVDTGGPNVYAARITEMKEQKVALISKLKKKFGQSLASLGNV